MSAVLDTSGKVATPDGFWTVWLDLSPFTQGYIEALFAAFRQTMTRADERKRPVCTLKDGQIWLLKCGRGGFSRATLRVPYRGHGSTATNYMCAGLVRRGWLAENDRNGVLRITEAGERALHTAMPLGFSDLAPEALSRIIADCEAIMAAKPALYDQIHDGGMVWRNRQAGFGGGFEPLTVQLGDDGKVRFAQ